VKLGGDEIRIEKRPGGVSIYTPAGIERKFSVDEARLLSRDLTSPLAQTLTVVP